ncbi:MAG: phage integrase N-terminal SAM-like domain-containing protein [Pseudomonadota bacterium]
MSDQSNSSEGTAPDGPRRPRLLEQVHEAIRRNHYSRRTEGAYVHWIRRFIYSTGKREPAAQYPAVLGGMR